MKRPGIILNEVVRSVFKKPATTHYPFVAVQMPPRFRGRLTFYPAKCVGCKICMKDCPSGAIEIQKVAEKTYRAVIDTARCLYCGQCVDSCNKDALESTDVFELAGFHRADLKIVFQPLPRAEQPAENHDETPPADSEDAPE